VAVYGRYAERMLAESGSTMVAVEPSVQGALQARLDELLADARPVQLLDAGCGSNRAVPIADDCYVVGIDLSEEQLADNSAVDEAIVGDVQTCELEGERFDAVVCWNVLEHLPNPQQALLNFKAALKPGGVMVLAVPHVMSVKGLITRFTPFWFHRWIWQHLLDRTLTVDRFPTVMSAAISPRRLRAFARDNGFSVELMCEYEGWPQKKVRGKLRLTGWTFHAVQLLVSALSFGRITAEATDAVVIMRKAR
jgi:2-polyprenyl-3-methyl-5-hydroxy-6-metoxy-1,4-benzoquinol methylase